MKPIHRMRPAGLTTAILLAGAAAHAAPAPAPAPEPAAAPAPIIVDVHMAAPGVLVVELQTGPVNEAGGTATRADVLDLAPAKWRVNGQNPSAISHSSTPWDEARSVITAKPNLYPVTVRHKVYLRLPRPLQEGQLGSIVTPYGETRLNFGSRSTFCESIKVNQVGYSKLATSRFANFGAWLGDGGALRLSAAPRYDVIDERSGRTVLSAQGAYVKDDTAVGPASSGEHVYRLRLDTVPEGGPYYVSVPGCGRSRAFGIGDEASRKIAYVMSRGMYHQRCGIALTAPYTTFTREVCHAQVADTRTPWVSTPSLTVPATMPMTPIKGGHHDAGDFDRRPMHTIIPILMLSYYEAVPNHFIDRQYNIPESGNGIPDFLDEALWAVLSWEYLQVSDSRDPQFGGVRAGTETNMHPAYGIHSAANDTARYGTWAVSEEVTALAAGIFAQASRMVRPHDPVRANALLGRARAAWAYLARTTDVKAPKTRFMYPALQLYLATGETGYHTLFRAAAQAIVVKTGAWPEQYLPGNTSATAQTVHFSSYLLGHGRPVDSALAAALKNRILYFADAGGYMGPPPETQAYPQGATRFMAWGASTTQGKYADVYAFASLFAPDPAKKQSYLNAVSQYADFALGLNPLGRSFVTGLGSDQVRSPTHLDSYYTKYGRSDGVTSEHVGKPIGNVPGIVVFGPTEGRSGATYQTAISNKLYPKWESLPGLRRWGDGWSLINGNEFSTWETMVWNVAMHGFLYDASKDPNAAVIPGECSGSAPLPQTRTLACPTGQTGGIRQERRVSCVGSGWVMGGWQTVGNSCTAPPAAPQCKVGSTGVITLSALPSNVVCVQRTDTGAQQRVADGKAVFTSPAATPGVTVYGFSGMNSYGACVTKVSQMSCPAATQ